MSESDWDTVTYLRKKPPKASEMKTNKAVNSAIRQGVPVETSKKFNAATNKHTVTTMNTAKLDRETEELHHDRVDLGLARLIQQARNNKGWTQKDLAAKINEKQQVIGEYESGKAVPNHQVINKMERALDVRLRGKDKGKPLNPPTKGK